MPSPQSILATLRLVANEALVAHLKRQGIKPPEK